MNVEIKMKKLAVWIAIVIFGLLVAVALVSNPVPRSVDEPEISRSIPQVHTTDVSTTPLGSASARSDSKSITTQATATSKTEIDQSKTATSKAPTPTITAPVQTRTSSPSVAPPKTPSPTQSTSQTPAQITSTSPSTYTNVDGEQIPVPTFANAVPAGATAQCRDGSYSFSQNRRGTCSHHGGVEQWL